MKARHRTSWHPTLPPGPWLPPSAQALAWTLQPTTFLERCHRVYGDVFTVRLDIGRGARVLIAEPQAAKTLLNKPSLTAPPATRVSIAPVFGEESVLLSDGDEHRRRRQAMLPAYHSSHFGRYRKLIVSATDREVDNWPLGRPFSLRPRLQAITLEAILDSIFGFDNLATRAEMGRRVERLLSVVANRGAALALALPSQLRTVAARGPLASRRAELDAAIFAEMARRRSANSTELADDALSHLLGARDEDGRPLTDQEVCDQVRTLLLAGHESTATSLAWALEHLVHNPRSLERLTTEVCEGGGENYANAVVTETLRLNPPLPNTQRELTEPWNLGKYTLPAGTLIAPCAFLIHRRPDLYPNPRSFEPERFLDWAPQPAAWLPFGGGPRRCLGANFARLQMVTVLHRLCQRTRLTATSSHRETVRRRGIVFAPSRGTRVVMAERHSSSPAASI
jgi:cytochrome P450 family 135